MLFRPTKSLLPASILAAAIFLTSSCGRTTEPGPRKVVILPIENLTADETDPAADALHFGFIDALQAQPGLLVAAIGHPRELPSAPGAIRVMGYAAPGRYHVEAGEQILRCSGTPEDCLPRLIQDLERALGITGRAPIPAAALLALSRSRHAAPGQAIDLLRLAANQAPEYSAAWVAFGAVLANAQGREAALAELQKAPVARMSPFDAARIELQMADLRQDLPAHRAAMAKLAAASPADTAIQLRAAAEATAARDFDSAVAIYQRILALTPSAGTWNDLAYVHAYRLDKAAAQAAVEKALSQAPNEVHYLDTAGDIAFFFGDYAEAAKHYMKAAGANAVFMNGIEFWKAAEAFRLAGRLEDSRAALHNFEEVRAKARTPSVRHYEAVWRWRTGDRDGAANLFREIGTPQARFYLALIALHGHDFAAARRLQEQIDPSDVTRYLLEALISGDVSRVPPQIPAALLQTVHYRLTGNEAESKRLLQAARAGAYPLQEDSLRQMAGEKNRMPAQPDDWLAFILR